MINIRSVAVSLAKSHIEDEPDIQAVYWFPSGSGGKAEIRLIEVSRNAIPSGTVHPFSFAPIPAVPYRTLVADVTLEEWEKICSGEIELPKGWSLQTKVNLTPGS
ncbi:MAG: hypothetical protein IIB58_01455 [Planctomycetes bacterium]|nr:hypothetical protein [Planctomycetota bacterium]